jgi:hypothetical protein
MLSGRGGGGGGSLPEITYLLINLLEFPWFSKGLGFYSQN